MRKFVATLLSLSMCISMVMPGMANLQSEDDLNNLDHKEVVDNIDTSIDENVNTEENNEVGTSNKIEVSNSEINNSPDKNIESTEEIEESTEEKEESTEETEESTEETEESTEDVEDTQIENTNGTGEDGIDSKPENIENTEDTEDDQIDNNVNTDNIDIKPEDTGNNQTEHNNISGGSDENLDEDKIDSESENNTEVTDEIALPSSNIASTMSLSRPVLQVNREANNGLSIDHKTGEDNHTDEKIEFKQDSDGVISAFIKASDSIDFGLGEANIYGYIDYGKISLDGIELPENPEIKQEVALKQPIITEVNGNRVSWTNLKYMSDGWHLDGVAIKKHDIGVVSVSDKTGTFENETSIKGDYAGWHDLDHNEIAEILANEELPVDTSMKPPAISSETAKKLNDYLTSKGWSGDVDSITWEYKFCADGRWHLDGTINVQQQTVNTSVSDISGQLYESSNGKINITNKSEETFWHDIGNDEFLLPDPGAYSGQSINLTPSQLKHVQDKFNATTGWSERGDKDGTIEWKFVSKTDSTGKNSWELQGNYIPNTISFYVYYVGAPNIDGTSGTNGNKVSDSVKDKLDKDQEWADEWYTAGKMNMELTEELKQLIDSNDMNGLLQYIKDNGSGSLQIYDKNAGFWEGKAFDSIDWMDITKAAGARDYLNNINYTTFHLNGIFRNPKDDTGDTGGSGDTGDGENPGGGTGDGGDTDTGDNTNPGGGDNTNPDGGDNTNPGTGDGGTGDGGDNTNPGGGDNTNPGTGDGGDTDTGDSTNPGGGDTGDDSTSYPSYDDDDDDDNDYDDTDSIIDIEDTDIPLDELPRELWISEEYKPFIYGRSGTTLNPDDTLLRCEIAVMLFRILSDDAHNAYDTVINDYSDVTMDQWFNEAVSTMTAMNVVSGFDGEYCPGNSVTHEQFVNMMHNMFNTDIDSIKGIFDSAAIKYSADMFMTRSQAVVVINTLLQRNGYENCVPANDKYTDIDSNREDYWDLMYASYKG